jgi:hypothetical protein
MAESLCLGIWLDVQVDGESECWRVKGLAIVVLLGLLELNVV